MMVLSMETEEGMVNRHQIREFLCSGSSRGTVQWLSGESEVGKGTDLGVLGGREHSL